MIAINTVTLLVAIYIAVWGDTQSWRTTGLVLVAVNTFLFLLELNKLLS